MKYLIALLTAATGILHILAGFGLIADPGTFPLLIANGVGYLVLLVLFWMAPGNGGIIRWILLVYALVTLVGYFIIGAGMAGGTIPLVIKGIELLLILLLLLYRGTQSAAVSSRPAAGTRAAEMPSAGSRMGSAAVDLTDDVSAAAVGTAAGVGAAMDRVGDDMTDMADRAGDAVGDAYDATADAVGDMADRAGDAVGDAYDATADAVGDMADSAGDAVGDAYDAAGDAVAGAADRVDDAVDATGEAVGDAYDAAGDAVAGAADRVGDAVDATGDAVGDMADRAGDAVGDAYGATADAVGDMADRAGDAVGDAYDATADAVGDLADRAGDVVVGASDAARGAVVGGAMAAAEADEAQMEGESEGDDLLTELREYFQSFGSGSEFSRPIEYIEGIGAAYGQKLRAIDINTVLDLIINGATRRGRKMLSDQSGISQSLILTWVNHVDLFRIKGVAQEYADLLEESGVDTVVELAQRNPANLHKRMIEVNEQKALVRRTPHASEVQSWVEQAKGLRRVIHY